MTMQLYFNTLTADIAVWESLKMVHKELLEGTAATDSVEDNIFLELKNILCEHLKAGEQQISLESHLLNDLDADSLDVIELVQEVEDRFCIEVSDDMIEKLVTVGDIVTYIASKTSNREF